MATCARCRRQVSILDRLVVNYDDAQHEREPLRADLCRRCAEALAKWLHGEPTSASERWRHAEDGPPFIGLIFDEMTVRCLDAGVVNARAQVAAHHALVSLDASTTAAAQVKVGA